LFLTPPFIIFLLDINVFSLGCFGELFKVCSEFKDPSLLQLAEAVKRFALHSRADGTVTNYLRNFNRWVSFAKSKGFVVFPATPIDVALFIGHLALNAKSVSVLQATSAGITWIHELVGFSSPMHNSFIKSILEGAKRQYSKPTNRKEPISLDVLVSLCSKYQHSSNVLEIRDITMALLLFAGFCVITN
jgi:hypothetical protein